MTLSLNEDLVIERLFPFGVLVRAPAPGMTLAAAPTRVLRALARSEHLVVLRGYQPPADAEGLSGYGAAWGEPLRWPFGPVLELVEKPAAGDHIFASCSVPLHWDGMYRGHIPEFQLFTCQTAPGSARGGRTLFTHTTRLLAEMPPAERAVWAQLTITYDVDRVSHYGGRVTAPLLAENPNDGAPVIRFNEPPPAGEDFPNPHRLTVHGAPADQVEKILADLTGRLRDARYLYAHEWRAGDVVIADNYTLLHGREAFETGEPRHLRRLHVLGEPPLENQAIG